MSCAQITVFSCGGSHCSSWSACAWRLGVQNLATFFRGVSLDASGCGARQLSGLGLGCGCPECCPPGVRMASCAMPSLGQGRSNSKSLTDQARSCSSCLLRLSAECFQFPQPGFPGLRGAWRMPEILNMKLNLRSTPLGPSFAKSEHELDPYRQGAHVLWASNSPTPSALFHRLARQQHDKSIEAEVNFRTRKQQARTKKRGVSDPFESKQTIDRAP